MSKKVYVAPTDSCAVHVCCAVLAGSKETAFIYAVTSAGVVHAVTQACSSGNLTDCSCDSTGKGLETPEGWKWGGCR
jgi:hypothetical protein